MPGDPKVPSAVSPLGIRPSVILVTTTAAAAPAPELPKCSEFPQNAFKAPDFPKLSCTWGQLCGTRRWVAAWGPWVLCRRSLSPKTPPCCAQRAQIPQEGFFTNPPSPRHQVLGLCSHSQAWRCVGSFWFSSP